MYNLVIMEKLLIISVMTVLGLVLWRFGVAFISSTGIDPFGFTNSTGMVDLIGFTYSVLLIGVIEFFTSVILKYRNGLK